MILERFHSVDEILAEALELPTQERHAFIERRCHGRPVTLAEVRRLLVADRDAQSFLERPPAEAAHQLRLVSRGERLGAYRIEREIGRGGMGTVFLGTRADGQYERKVAIKVLSGARFHPDGRARFRLEREILAGLEHPAIARLYDSGETAEGYPYLVMEHIAGEPIDAYCDRNRLSVEDRLRLFLKVLAGVAHAHQNLLVHRDLKPANLLVTADGEPKIVDFGIAKQLGTAPGNTLTLTSMQPLTPAYASPEQIEGKAISTASDVYSLGVVLYELFTGMSPYGVLLDAPHAVFHAVKERQPERPSQAVARSEKADELAAQRATSVRGLARSLAGDLDLILLTALRKEPERRYGGAHELAGDLRNTLLFLPIAARPDSLTYRAGKFVRRHRLGVGLAACGLALLGFQQVRLMGETSRAVRERDKTTLAIDFLSRLVQGADPYGEAGRDLSARELLTVGAKRAEEDLAAEPQVLASVLFAIGEGKSGLADYGEALTLFERALALRREQSTFEPEELASKIAATASLRVLNGKYDGAEPMFDEAIATLRKRHQPEDRRRLAEALARHGLALSQRHQRSGPEISARIEALHREALSIYDALDGRRSLGASEALRFLSLAVRDRGEPAEAIELGREAIAIRTELKGGDHPDIALWRAEIAFALLDAGKLEEAEAEIRAALPTLMAALPADHTDLIMARNNLALVRDRLGHPEEAEPIYREVAASYARRLGPEHGDTLIALGNLVSVLPKVGKPEEALALATKILPLQRNVLGADSHLVGITVRNLARIHLDLGHPDQSLAYAREALAIHEKQWGKDNPNTAISLRSVGRILLALGRATEAEAYFRRGYAAHRQGYPNGHFIIGLAAGELGGCLLAEQRFTEAEPLLLEARSILAKELPADDKRIPAAVGALVDLYRAWGKEDKAAQLTRELDRGAVAAS